MSVPTLFLSWVDVARWLWNVSQDVSEDASRPRPPEGLVYAHTFWDRLLIGVVPDTKFDTIFAWLKGCLNQRWNHTESYIILEGEGPELSRLPVVVEEIPEEEMQEWRDVPFQPRFLPLRTANFSKKSSQLPDDLPSDHPAVLVFHSFKGGVGRTLCALALTQAYAKAGKKILLVDADFEAPGISFLFEKRKPDPDFALADLLSMLHADPDPLGANALASAQTKVANQRLGDVFVLPCFRNLQENVSLEIRPADLVASTAHPPFFLTDILSRLGKALGVDLVIVDLRAGLSELSAPLLLDPRVKRLLVANVSGQTIQGTCFLIDFLGRILKANGWPSGNLPAVILNQIPVELMSQEKTPINEKLEKIVEGITVSLMTAFPSSSAEDENPIELRGAEEGIPHVLLTYNALLALLADDWDQAMATIRETPIPNEIWKNLQFWLPSTKTSSAESDGVDKEIKGQKTNLEDQRSALRDFTGKLVTAEGSFSGTAKNIDFLPMQTLLHLAQDHLAKVPMVVSIGAKGAGKTYSFLNIAYSKLWTNFVKKVDKRLECTVVAPILPVLWSKNVDTGAMNQLQQECRKSLKLQNTMDIDPFELPVVLSGFQGGKHDIYAWRTFWVNAVAWSLGLPRNNQDAGEALLRHLREKKASLVVVIDGLEETFSKFTSSESQQIALCALIQEVPNWLRTLPGSPLGIIIFVRQDMVLHAIPQNRTQFTDRYESYALRWSWKEALGLVAWVSEKSKSLKSIGSAEFSKLPEGEQAEKLTPLWGSKLGGDHSNEALSNNWVLSVLSDLRGRIQARDVVRFLHLAASKSVGNTKTVDRILAPVAMREAIQPCSEKKVAEMGEENTPLKGVFEKIGNCNSTSPIFSPCTYKDLLACGLAREQVELMEENGIVFFDQGEKKYHFPEIFRLGLGVERVSGARPKVVSLIRKARNQGRF